MHLRIVTIVMEEIGYFMKLSPAQCTNVEMSDNIRTSSSGNRCIFVKIRGSRCRASKRFLVNSDVIVLTEHHPQYVFHSSHVYRMRVKETGQPNMVIMVDNIKEFYDYSLMQYQNKIKGELRLAIAAYKCSNVKRIKEIQRVCSAREAMASQTADRETLGRAMAHVFQLLRNDLDANRLHRREEKEQLRLQSEEIHKCLAQMKSLI